MNFSIVGDGAQAFFQIAVLFAIAQRNSFLGGLVGFYQSGLQEASKRRGLEVVELSANMVPRFRSFALRYNELECYSPGP